LRRAWVQELQPKEKKVLLSTGEEILYDQLIIATGSKSNKFGWTGQDLPGVQGLYSYQDLRAQRTSPEQPFGDLCFVV